MKLTFPIKSQLNSNQIKSYQLKNRNMIITTAKKKKKKKKSIEGFRKFKQLQIRMNLNKQAYSIREQISQDIGVYEYQRERDAMTMSEFNRAHMNQIHQSKCNE